MTVLKVKDLSVGDLMLCFDGNNYLILDVIKSGRDYCSLDYMNISTLKIYFSDYCRCFTNVKCHVKGTS